MNTQADFEQWAEQHGLSITKHPWHSDVYEAEATLYAYLGWEACQNTYFYNSNVPEKAEKLIKETKSLLESIENEK